MSVTLCALLWAVPGQERALVQYEDRVLSLLVEHGGRVLQRARSTSVDDHPFEVQLLQFPSELVLERFMSDGRRAALAGERDRAIARTEVLRVDLV